ncbi:rab GTPase-binding effector protein 2 isoform X1 [Tachysurus ichikawai]
MRTEESVQLSSLKTETDRIQSDKEKTEGELQECHTELQGLRVALSHLQRDIKTQSHDKTVLHDQCLELRSQVISLRSQLDTSQAVQRDFVQLSQSLQVKMEQIRQAESLDQVRRVLGEPLEEESDQLSSAT